MIAETLVQPVVARARACPEQLALVFVGEDGATEAITAGQFHRQAAAYGAGLCAAGVAPGDLVVLVLQHSRELLAAFWGALYMGAVPSILPFLTEKLDPVVYGERIRALVTRAGVKVVITYTTFAADLRALLADVDCAVLTTADLAGEERQAAPSIPYVAAPDQIAFLQHSSGTTGLQKGVALTHRAVLNQLHAYSQAIALQPSDVVVSWLPLYHDMGLIAGFVLPLVTGTPLVLLSPFHWVRDPKSLLWAIHHHKGTLSWLPNFAYNHIPRSVRPRELEGLDLRSWRMAINCSEPVRHDSHELLRERLAPYGFSAHALATCYAMAENTFAVSQSRPQSPPAVDWVDRKELQGGTAIAVPAQSEGATPVVSCGWPIEGTEVGIVDRERGWLPPRAIGEIVIRSNCMLREYFREPQATEAAFWGEWYCSGDLGYLADGQLYVTGRKKDLLIVGGKNIYPQDLEAIASTVEGIHPGRVVAFGVQDARLGTEMIVMICELRPEPGALPMEVIELELRRRVVRELDVTLGDVRLVRPRWLLKTSSGKIARSANRDRYLRSCAGDEGR